jgi:hypothetical protein
VQPQITPGTSSEQNNLAMQDVGASIAGVSSESLVQDRQLEESKLFVHREVLGILLDKGVRQELIDKGEIRLPTVIYLVYWWHRLANNHGEQAQITKHLIEYLRQEACDSKNLADALIQHVALKQAASLYVNNLLLPTKSVDLCILRQGIEDDILCVKRDFYPLGVALPGGLIRDDDEDNCLGLPSELFAALRVAGEKVLGLVEGARYSREQDAQGAECFRVCGATEEPAVIIFGHNRDRYRYRESIRSEIRPSDPRHIVDTIAFKGELRGEVPSAVWSRKSEIMRSDIPAGGFSFQHHREIVSYLSAQTSLVSELEQRESAFVRGIIANPLSSYRELKSHFTTQNNSPNSSFAALFPVVDRVLKSCFSEEINSMCAAEPLLSGIRDKAVISLRQVCLKNRTFCPYLPTLRAIAEGVAFFDVVARHKRGVYDSLPSHSVVEHDPRSMPNASYHMYRYKYRLDEMLSWIPNEIVIPTFEPLSATDLMRVRGVPIRFVGIVTDFCFVDEFEQSPEEFLMHDCNHSWRMIMEDRKYCKDQSISQEELAEDSSKFIEEYLASIKIRSTDSEPERELKKLKKMILFEIVHEDARPFLSSVIGEYIQQKEGGAVPFEVPWIDPLTGYMDVVDTLDTGISTLSYVRNKLQHGFYDHVEAQTPQIVGLKYRTAEWIARAAYEMLVELNSKPGTDAEVDDIGNVSYEWLLKRTCSVGPDNIHDAVEVDLAVAQFGDGAEKLNPKRYQAGRSSD